MSIFYKNKQYKQNLLDAYPIGCYYMSISTTSPSTLFGGTWTLITDRMLINASDSGRTVNTTGGANSITLNSSNVPSHYHTMGHSHSISHFHYPATSGTPKYMEVYQSVRTSDGHAVSNAASASQTRYYFCSNGGSFSALSYTDNNSQSFSNTNTNTKDCEGSNSITFDLRPDRYIVNIWQRTA